MVVSRKSVSELQGSAKEGLNYVRKRGLQAGCAVATSLVFLFNSAIPAMAAEQSQQNISSNISFVQQYHKDSAYVPYNENWGPKDAYYEYSIDMALGSGRAGKIVGVVNKKNVNGQMLTAIYNCLGKSVVENSSYDWITFQIKDTESAPNGKENNPSIGPLKVGVIDTKSFAFAPNGISSYEPLTAAIAYLPVTVFMAPEGQQWISEEAYRSYAEQHKVIYECNDGTLVFSYQDFKDYERTHRPKKPAEYPLPPEGLSYLVLSSDGTIWRDQTILEEYLHWQIDANYRMQNGVYVGAYGAATSFEEYVRIYNNLYLVKHGLSSEEQFYGAHGFLYMNAEKAKQSLETLENFQKVKKQ